MIAGTKTLPIIQTKFCAPRLTNDLIDRERLLALLDGSLEVPLTLVSAPAGYGKSVLVSQWLERQQHNTFWLSLSSSDGDMRQFLSYLIADIRNEFPGACETSHGLLHMPEKYPVEVISSYLLNDLDELDTPCSIVLDDYHLLALSSSVHELLEMIMQHPPQGVHFVLITRRDPPLPLMRLRAINHLLEIRLEDLRFTRSEIRELLTSGHGIDPGDDALDNLQHEMEGWAVGLRLVSLALRHISNPDDFLKSIQGGIPQSQEYLVNEVLSALPPGMRDTMLKSSLLDRFCDDLVRYVSGTDMTVPEDEEAGAQDFIRQLEERNLFTICIDGHGRWFRFHHLFQDLLQNELRKSPEKFDIAEIHLQASQWYESNGYIDDAIKHALLAGDTLFAVNIVERHFYDVLEKDQQYVLENWLGQIPAKVIEERPVLLLALMSVLAFRQQFEKIDELLKIVEPLLSETKGHENLIGEVDFYRGYLLFWAGEFEESIKHLERAQSHIARNKHMLIADADLHLAIVLYMNGQGDEALRMIDEQMHAYGGIQLSRRVAALAFVQMFSGDLGSLELSARRMRSIDRGMRSPLTDSWSYYFSGCTEFHRFRPGEAAKHFARVAQRPHLTDVRVAVDAFTGLALIQQMSGEPGKAEQTIDSFERYAGESPTPENQDLLDSCKARLGLLQGKDQFAATGQMPSTVPPGVFDLFLWLEVPALTRIRVLAAEGSETSLLRAQELLDEARQVSESCQLTVHLIEIAVLQALVLEKQGQKEAAEDALELAIGLAEPGFWVRPFVEAGRPMAELVERFNNEHGQNGFVGHLLDTLKAVRSPTLESGLSHTRTVELPAFEADSPFDGLTNRELDILELLAQRMQNKEIANQLFISTHTVKDHLKHIYQKLGVSNRRQAVARAIEQGDIQQSP